MTAGKGVVHAEMPSDEIIKNGGKVEGFQLWLNLPKKLKMIEPRYQDFDPETIPAVTLEDGKSLIKIIAGKFNGVESPVQLRFPTVVFDARLEAKGKVCLTVPKNMNSMVYCWRGSGKCGTKQLNMGVGAILENNSDEDTIVELESDKDSCMYSLFLAAAPIGEPVARWGPFVMNSQDELAQARDDYRSGRLGGQIAGAAERQKQTEKALATQQKNSKP